MIFYTAGQENEEKRGEEECRMVGRVVSKGKVAKVADLNAKKEKNDYMSTRACEIRSCRSASSCSPLERLCCW